MKSASEFKPKMISGEEKRARQKQLEELPMLEETWENALQAFVNTAEVSVQLAKRVDNLLNIRDMVYQFWGNDYLNAMDPHHRMRYLYSKLELSVQTYEKVFEIIKSFEMDEFLKEDMKDYFEDIIPKAEDLSDEDELLNAAIVFLTVKPWGEKMTALHHTMLDEKKQREYLEQ